VIGRPGFDQNSIAQQFDSDDYAFIAPRITTNTDALSAQDNGQILIQSVPQLDISSTRIRDNLQHEEQMIQWMPEQVYRILRGFIDDDR
jgi:nicotinic acid mononucleotide adenylyltransferase